MRARWHHGGMSDPVTPLPESKAFGEDERSVLLGYLTFHRVVLARKVEGATTPAMEIIAKRARWPSARAALARATS